MVDQNSERISCAIDGATLRDDGSCFACERDPGKPLWWCEWCELYHEPRNGCYEDGAESYPAFSGEYMMIAPDGDAFWLLARRNRGR